MPIEGPGEDDATSEDRVQTLLVVGMPTNRAPCTANPCHEDGRSVTNGQWPWSAGKSSQVDACVEL